MNLYIISHSPPPGIYHKKKNTVAAGIAADNSLTTREQQLCGTL